MDKTCYSKDLDLCQTLNVRQRRWVLSLRLTSVILADNFNGLGTIQLSIISLSPLCDMSKLCVFGLSITGILAGITM